MPGASPPSGLMLATITRLRFAFIAALIVPMLVFFGAAWLDYDRQLDREMTNAKATADILREHALKVLETTDLLIHEANRRIENQDWASIRANRDSLTAAFAAMIANYPQISGLALTDGEGRQWVKAVIDGYPLPSEGLDVTDREFWRAQQAADLGAFVTHSYIGINSGRENFAISRRRSVPDGHFDGTIHVGVAVSYFTAFWDRAMRDQPAARVTLLRSDGEILAHSRRPDGPDRSHVSPNGSLLRNLATHPDGSVYRARSTRDGLDCLYASARVGTYPLVVLYRLPIAAVMETWRNRLFVLCVTCALVVAALGGTVLLALHQARLLEQEHERRAAMEKTALQGQRSEILGELAAGIAHDFGNIVQAVESGAMLLVRRSTDERVLAIAKRIADAANQGRWLTSRMLAIASPQPADVSATGDLADPANSNNADPGTPNLADPANSNSAASGTGGRAASANSNRAASATSNRVDLVTGFDPAEAIAEICRLLATTIGRGYRVRREITSEGLPPRVRGIKAGLDGAIMNLAVNARDAMPDGGTIVIQIRPERIGARGGAVPANLPPGLYARISVTDSGQGMPPAVLARAGEPFFTTKPPGRGTGLGLASVRGFAVSVGGGFQIYSTPGAGTAVTLWLPQAVTDIPGTETPPRAAPALV